LNCEVHYGNSTPRFVEGFKVTCLTGELINGG